MKEKLSNLVSGLSKATGVAKNRLANPNLRNMRLRSPIKSVGMKLFFMFFVSIVAVVLVVGIASYQISKNVITSKVANATHQTIVQATDKIDFLLKNLDNLSIQIMSDEIISDNLTNYKDQSISQFDRLQAGQTVTTRLKSYVLSNNQLADINIVPISANETNSFKTAGNNEDIYAQEWFNSIVKADGRTVWLPTRKNGYITSNSGNVFALGRVLRNIKSGSIEGVMIVEVRASALQDALGQISIGDGSEIAVVSPDNKIIFAASSERIEENYTIDIPGQIQKTGKTSDSFHAAKDGTEHLVVFDPIDTAQWYLLGAVPMSELLQETRSISNITIIMIVVAALLAVAIGFLVARMIARPLEVVRNLMMEGARGNLRVRTHFGNRRDEIGELGNSFNIMMEQITGLVGQTNNSAQEVLSTAAELSEASKQTAQSAKEIAVATEEIASGATSLAIEAERGSGLVGNISEKVNQVVEANSQMESAASEVQQSSEKGIAYMSELIMKTNATEQMTRSMVEKVEKLQESTRSIRKILDVLNNITKQTNILSLNATIEAARAGAAGKGFMVVADEIRKLADQSKQSIDVVGQITETIQNEVQETVSVLSEAYPLFKEQIDSVKEADQIFKQVQLRMNGFVRQLQEVTNSVQELKQSQTILSDAMSNVSAVAEESSATSQEVASLSSEQLNISNGLVRLSEKLEELSNSLKESLSKFTI
mgnify:CR=1 FL=1